MSFWKRYYPVYALVFAAVITLTLLADHAVDLAVQTAAASSDADPVVLIDPGHGGEDGGACTNDGVREADLNLEISGVLADLCRVTGFPYRMIRTEDKAVYSPQAGTISEKKISDLKKVMDGKRSGYSRHGGSQW